MTQARKNLHPLGNEAIGGGSEERKGSRKADKGVGR